MKEYLHLTFTLQAERPINEFDSCYSCFCPHADRRNSFVICETCKAEIHERCYGITNIDDDDEEEEFYCDVCLDKAKDSKGRVNQEKEVLIREIIKKDRTSREDAVNKYYK